MGAAYFASPTAFAPFLPNRFARLAIPARIFLFLCFDRLVFSICEWPIGTPGWFAVEMRF
jgi:hypothetical protein